MVINNLGLRERYKAQLNMLMSYDRESVNPHYRSLAERDHKDFSDALRSKHCYLCCRSLSSFYADEPCMHWLLRPSGVKKADIERIFDKYLYLQIQTYLRWLANSDKFACNINELAEEGSGGKVFEITIRYKKIEWAFSCSQGDFQGHSTTENAKHPHYHFQMRIDGLPFINYNDFHLPLHEQDIVYFETLQQSPGLLRGHTLFGEGINDIMSDDMLDTVIKHSSFSENPDDATFKFDTIVIADEGSFISGDDIYRLAEEAKSKGVSFASLAHKIPNAKANVMVSPGDGVVEQATRKGRKKSKKKDLF